MTHMLSSLAGGKLVVALEVGISHYIPRTLLNQGRNRRAGIAWTPSPRPH